MPSGDIMKVTSITDSVTADGLRLAGIEKAFETEDEKEAEDVYKELLENEEVGIIILTEDLAQKMSEDVLELRKEKKGILPMVIEIPGMEGSVPERREFIDKLVKRAVGIKVEE